MSPVRAEDLTPEARRRLGLDKAATKRRPKRSGTTDAAPCVGSCSCGETFPSYTAWERHADQAGPGHRRWTIDAEASTQVGSR